MKRRFSITYATTTEESAAYGDHARRGFLPKTGTVPRRNHHPKNPARFTLREALEILDQHDAGGEPRETDGYPVTRQCPPRWVTVSDFSGPWDACTRLSLHFPRTVTPSTALRLARLAGARAAGTRYA